MSEISQEQLSELREKCSRLDHDNRMKQGQIDSLSKELQLFKKLYYDLTKEDRHEKQEIMESKIDIVEEIMKDLVSVNPSNYSPFPYYPPYIRDILNKHLSK